MIHPEDRQKVREVLQQAADPAGNGDINVEIRHITSSGEICWVLLRGGVEFSGSDSERVAVRVSGIIMDITNRKRAEEERLAFVGAAAHDLKSPVTSIRAFAQVGQRLHERQSLDADRLTEILSSVESATDQLEHVIQDLLDAAHMRAGLPLVLRPELIDLVPLLQAKATAWQEASPHHVIRFTPDVESLIGRWDAARLQRVFDNVLANAVKFTPTEKRIDILMRREVGRSWEQAVVTVIDEGIGVAAHDLERIFDWFQRGGNVPTSIGGTGIGLAGARQIVEQHGGVIEFERDVQVGSKLIITLPIEPSHESPAPVSDPAAST